MAADTYNKVFTMHGVIMVFFFLVPSVPATHRQFSHPHDGRRQGPGAAQDQPAELVSLHHRRHHGHLHHGRGRRGYGLDLHHSALHALSEHQRHLHGLAVFVAGFSSIFTGLNFIVTIHKMRCPGMTWFRLPLFVWSHYAASILMVLGTPVLAITMVLVVLERTVGIGVFDPTKGGDPLLFQHLFWFYSHPAVYIMILPGMGVISEVISTFSRKRVFGYTAVAFSSVAIAVFGFFVWAHHMFIMGISNYAALVFSLLTMLVAVPSAIKIFNWAFTLYKGSITFETPMLYAFGFMGLFTIGGMTGVFLGTTGTDIHLTETYFIVAHFHFVMVGGMLMAFLSGIHFWWPKMDRAHVSGEDLAAGRGGHLHRLQLHVLPAVHPGHAGHAAALRAYPPEFQALNVFSTAARTILGVGYLLPDSLPHLVAEVREIAGNNPWQATGLEWQTQSPPLTENFPRFPSWITKPTTTSGSSGREEKEVASVG
jgi:cytochrome c oxidase subunit I